MTTSPPAATDELPEAACWKLLRQAVIGRLAVATDDGPDIFPINFVVDHGSIVFRTAAGRKFSSSTGQPVAFEVDGYDDGDATAWSVVVRGRAREIRDTDEVIEALSLPLFPWHAGPKPRFMRVTAAQVTGRRLHVAGGSTRG
ncbi:MAG: pyridoxamine 5'-phosphate oxidase family protein [Humibacillus sp.]|nr:pyridoxamine 5'-phosphate oxidase family protein [Humibacillus sp.]MDN5780182.1 pyridoxamine 5'-phosphate oxidase family protein [Humibacillus sp.]